MTTPSVISVGGLGTPDRAAVLWRHVCTNSGWLASELHLRQGSTSSMDEWEVVVC